MTIKELYLWSFAAGLAIGLWVRHLSTENQCRHCAHARRLRVYRSAAGVLVFGLLWLVLTASAPIPVQACNESNALYVRRGIIERTITSNGQLLRVPIGAAAGWSCTSQVEADAAFVAAATQVGSVQP